MKKILLFAAMLMLSVSAFAGSAAVKVTDRINFGISAEELYKIVNSSPLPNSHDNGSYGVYYYADVEDPIGVKHHLNSFAFDQNQLFSAIFDSTTTDQEHARIIESYVKSSGRIFKGRVSRKQNKSELLMYDSEKIVTVQRMFNNRTFITVTAFHPDKLKRISELFD